MAKDITYELTPLTDNLLIMGSENRYKGSAIYDLDYSKFFELWDVPEIPMSPGDTYYKIEAGEVGRWDLISYRHYRTVLYWWLICLANNVSNPCIVIPAGDTIRIPDLDSLFRKGILVR